MLNICLQRIFSLSWALAHSAGVTSAHKVLNFRAHRRGGSDILTWFENKYGDDVQQLEVLKLGDVLQEQGVNI